MASKKQGCEHELKASTSGSKNTEKRYREETPSDEWSADDSSSDLEDEKCIPEGADLNECLRNLATNFKVAPNDLDLLLHILRRAAPEGTELPNTARELLYPNGKTKKTQSISSPVTSDQSASDSE
ncbi:hypothetical protein ZHAS_00019896 [Anopheles sinensis]|uniref:Uncharacterized protein n=1 Tax=Anopheles sinensis TaxID=74873 RepID=A0A084WMH4_ANOSI|nr:hypothetical protein ZHAS_00019896 [Anopheles sinensis]